MAYAIENNFLNWGILLAAILGFIFLIRWLSKQLKGFTDGLSSHDVDHTWNRPWWRGGGSSYDSSSRSDRKSDKKKDGERLVYDPKTGKVVKASTLAAPSKKDHAAGKEGKTGHEDEEEEEEKEPDIQYDSDHRNAVLEWQKLHKEEFRLLDELRKLFRGISEKFTQIAVLQEEKIKKLKDFEDPTRWNDFRNKDLQEDIKALKTAAEQIPQHLAEIAESIEKQIIPRLTSLRLLLQQDENVIEYEIKNHEPDKDTHVENVRQANAVLTSMKARLREHETKLDAMASAYGSLASECQAYALFYKGEVENRLFVEKEQNIIRLHHEFDPGDPAHNPAGREHFFRIVDEEIKHLKALFDEFNRLDKAMHHFFIHGKPVGNVNITLHDMEDGNAEFASLAKRVINEKQLIIKPVTTDEEFRQLYALYLRSFHKDDRDTYDTLREYMTGEGIEVGEYYTELWVVKANTYVIGATMFDVIQCKAGGFTFGAAWYSFLAQEARKLGVARQYVEARSEIMHERSKKTGLPLYGIFTEFSDPKKGRRGLVLDEIDPQKKIETWQSMGFLEVDTYYESPPLEAGAKPTPMLLHCMPLAAHHWRSSGIPQKEFRNFLDSWVHWGFAYEDDEELNEQCEESKEYMLKRLKLVGDAVLLKPSTFFREKVLSSTPWAMKIAYPVHPDLTPSP